MKLGNARVSTTDQDLAIQRRRLYETGCEKLFEETTSGPRKKRPELEARAVAKERSTQCGERPLVRPIARRPGGAACRHPSILFACLACAGGSLAKGCNGALGTGRIRAWRVGSNDLGLAISCPNSGDC